MSERKGDWMQTFMGRQFWPLDPRSDDVHIDDIAEPLSKLCRYNGHCEGFYSVAEHSVLVSLNVPPEMALEGLMHDAAEAYLGDVIRPIKPFLTGLKEIESKIEKAIAARFGLVYPWPNEVMRVDAAILHDEQLSIMKEPPRKWHLPLPPMGVNIMCMEHQAACSLFLKRFEELTRARVDA